MSEVASIENLQTNAVDDFRVVLSCSEFMIGHQTEKDLNEVLNTADSQVLPESFRIEEIEQTAE